MSAPRVISVDFAAMSCRDRCAMLLDAYMKGLAGGQRIQVRHEDYWVEYRPSSASDMAAMAELYRLLRNQCPQACDLPDLNPGMRSRRGPGLPTYIR